jgi:hypothetical protein
MQPVCASRADSDGGLVIRMIAVVTYQSSEDRWLLDAN